MAFEPIPYRTLDELRKDCQYLDKCEWFSRLGFLTTNLKQNWEIFKLRNKDDLDFIKKAESIVGEPPSRVNIANQNLYPVEEHYYNEIYAYYFNLYEQYKRYKYTGPTETHRFRKLLENFYMNENEILACISHIRHDFKNRNTLVALKAFNRFANFHGIRVEDVETIFREWLL
jgi:hypothetical protein